MRDVFSEKVESVVVDSKQLYNEIGEYLKGIAPELMPRIFDLFTQAERSLARSEGGLGIGLSLAQRIV